jgi:hypothetical protein
MKLEFSRQIFEKYSNIKFRENPFSGNRVVPCGRTDMTKVIVAFRNFAKAAKIGLKLYWRQWIGIIWLRVGTSGRLL